MKLALVHDIAEGKSSFCKGSTATINERASQSYHFMCCVTAIIGDLTPSDGYTKQEKYELEYEAMLQMKRMLGANPAGKPSGDRVWKGRRCRSGSYMVDACAGPEFESLWREYEEGVTKEAQLVKDFDKVITSTLSDICEEGLVLPWSYM